MRSGRYSIGIFLEEVDTVEAETYGCALGIASRKAAKLSADTGMSIKEVVVMYVGPAPEKVCPTTDGVVDPGKCDRMRCECARRQFEARDGFSVKVSDECPSGSCACRE